MAKNYDLLLSKRGTEVEGKESKLESKIEDAKKHFLECENDYFNNYEILQAKLNDNRMTLEEIMKVFIIYLVYSRIRRKSNKIFEKYSF